VIEHVGFGGCGGVVVAGVVVGYCEFAIYIGVRCVVVDVDVVCVVGL